MTSHIMLRIIDWQRCLGHLQVASTSVMKNIMLHPLPNQWRLGTRQLELGHKVERTLYKLKLIERFHEINPFDRPAPI